MITKLTIELVPRTSWYNNLRNQIPEEKWYKLRRQVLERYHYKCGICGAKGNLHCHEIWRYDDRNHIQHLSGFIALCPLCHSCKHIGLAQKRAKQGKLDYKVIINHFMTVNGCDYDEFILYLDDVFAQWRIRSEHEWKLDLGKFAQLVQE